MQPIVVVVSLGILGLCLMTAAFVMAFRSPRFPDAPRGTRPDLLPRRLMMAGAALGVAFGLLALVPGVLPWVNTTEEYANLWIAAAGGALFGATNLHALGSATRRAEAAK